MLHPVEERRAHPRHAVQECGVLCLLDSESAASEQMVYVRDASIGGLGVFLDRKIARGTLVKVSVVGLSFVGRVAYCRGEEEGHAAGIALIGNTDEIYKLLRMYRHEVPSDSQA